MKKMDFNELEIYLRSHQLYVPENRVWDRVLEALREAYKIQLRKEELEAAIVKIEKALGDEVRDRVGGNEYYSGDWLDDIHNAVAALKPKETT